MKHLCIHECILKELTSKGAEESISPPHLTQPHQFVTKQQSKVSDVEKCQFQSKKLTEPMDNFWTEHSVTKTIVKNFFMEMMFFQKNEVSVVSVEKFVCQLEYPPDSNLRNPTIAFLYLLTEQLLSQKREQIMDNPLLPAFKILIDALVYLDKSRNTNVKRNKWSILCDTFYPPQEEAKNQLLHIFLTKCLHGQLPVLNNHGLFDCLTKRYCTTETNSTQVLRTKAPGGGHSKTVMTSPAATHLNRARTTGGGRSKTVTTSPAATHLNRARTAATHLNRARTAATPLNRVRTTGGGRSKTVTTSPAATHLNRARTTGGGRSKTATTSPAATHLNSATKPKNTIKPKSNQVVSSPCTPGDQEQRVSPRKTVEKRKIISNADKKDVKMSRKLQ
jgi:hypothetical protein